MANEIRVSSNLQITKNSFTVTGASSQTLSLTGSSYIGNIQTIGTSYEALSLGDLSDIRYLSINNISTASISVAMNSASQSFAVLRSGDTLILPPSGSFMSYVVKSSADGADVQIVATEQ